MKKDLYRIAAAVLALLMMLSLAACKDKEEESQPESAVVSEAAPTEAPAESGPAKLNANGKYDTIADFITSDIMQDQLNTMIAAQGGDGSMGIEVKGEGETLVYRFTYMESALEGVDIPSLSTALESAMDNMGDTFGDVAASLKDAVEVTDPVVKVIYQTEDGTELCSREFAATK